MKPLINSSRWIRSCPPNPGKKPPVVRLPPKSNLELTLTRGAQLAIIFLALLAAIFVLQAGSFLLAPFALAIVVGLMMGPIANKLESWAPASNGLGGGFRGSLHLHHNDRWRCGCCTACILE